MAKNSIRDYSATNSANTDIQSIDISEGCSPAGINNAIREVMADLKDVSTGAVALESPAMDSLTVNGDISLSASDPRLDFTDTDNSLIASISANNGNLTYQTHDSNRHHIFNNGNVGIGTATPIALLTMVAADGVMADQYVAKFTNSEATTGQNYGVFIAGGSSSADESFGVRNFDSSATYFKVRGDGNVGIGTQSPAATLTVAHTSGTDGRGIRLVNSSNNQTYETRIGVEGIENTSYAIKDMTADAVRFLIDANGNAGIGTSSPSTDITKFGGSAKGLSVAAGQPAIAVRATANAQYVGYFGQVSTNTYLGAIGGGSLIIQTGTSATAHLQIDSSGRILCGTSDTDVFNNTSGNGINIKGSAGAIEIANTSGETLYLNRMGTDGRVVNIRRSGTFIGGIDVTTSAVSYNTSSDYRLKTAVEYDWDATSRLKQLKPARFEWIVDGDNAVPVDGFLAHEVSHDSDGNPLVPEAISGTKDGMRDEEYQVSAATGDIYTPAVEATYDEDGVELTAAIDEVIHSADVERPDELAEGQQWRETTAAVMGTRSVADYQGIDQSKLVPLLVKTIQELEARITALEAN